MTDNADIKYPENIVQDMMESIHRDIDKSLKMRRSIVDDNRNFETVGLSVDVVNDSIECQAKALMLIAQAAKNLK